MEHIIWEIVIKIINLLNKFNKSKKEKYILFYCIEYLLKRFKGNLYISFQKLIKIKPRWEKKYINIPNNSEFC